MDVKDLRYFPKTYWLIGILFVVFIVQLIALAAGIPFTETLVLDPAAILEAGWVWGIFTNIFLHGGFAHLFFNCLALFFFGIALERIIGGRNLLKVFLIAGLFASVFYLVTSVVILDSFVPALGASGAIFGVIGAMVALRPHTKVIMLLFPVPMPLWVLAVFFVVIAVAWFGIGGGTGIAENAHLGGLIIGYVMGWHFKKREAKDPDFSWNVVYDVPKQKDPYDWIDEYR